MAEFDAGSVIARIDASTSGLHAAIERIKTDYKSMAQAIADAMRTVKKEETEANKIERERQQALQETARKAREAAAAEKQAAQEIKNAWRDLGIASGASFALITAGVWKAVDANNSLKASMVGLDSVATGNIGSYEKIKKELQQVQADGLIPLTNATQAYKNLISRYQDEDTAIKMFHKIADAAAFGRQAHLSLGEAIQGTSEGLRNEMSNMTDNGGITKNLSLMWKDYATQIGKTVGQLTEAEKRQAEVNGFMEEGKFQTGDLAKLMNTLSGQMSKASAETNMMAAAYGDALEPAMAGVVGQFSGIMRGVRDFIQASPGLTAGITTGALAMTGLVTVSSAWIALDLGAKIAAGFAALSGPVGLTMIALSALAAVIVGVTTAEQKHYEALGKQSEQLKSETRSIYDLTNEYEKLKGKAKLTTEEKERLKKVTEDLVDLAPEAVKGYDSEHNAIVDVNAALQVMVNKKKEALELDRKQIAIDLAKAETALKNLEATKKIRGNVRDDSLAYGTSGLTEKQKQEAAAGFQGEIDKTDAQITKQQAKVDALVERLAKVDKIIADTTLESVKKEIEAEEEKIRNKNKNTEPDDVITAAAKKRAQDQADLERQLFIEKLRQLEDFKLAELAEEEDRYQAELELAENNDELLEQVEQGYTDRMQAIHDKYAQEKADKERAEEDRKIEYLHQTNQISLQEYREHLQSRLTEYKEYSSEWIAISQKISDIDKSMQGPIAEWGKDLVDNLSSAIVEGENLADVFENLYKAMLKYFLQTQIFTPLFKNLGIPLPEYHSGGVISPIPKAHSGMYIDDISRTIIRAHSGLNLAPDEVPIIAQTGERILSREQNKEYEKGLKQGSESVNVAVNVINQSGQPVSAKQQDMKFDGEQYIINVVLDAVNTNKGGMRDILGGAR